MTAPLTPERILQAAEDVLRRHGPAKANVVDVARALGVSHGTVYRHFPSKQALREAVTRRWLHGFHERLEPITDLREWLHALFDAKRAKALEDPELFATYDALLADASGVVDEHVATLVGQLDGDRRRRADRARDLPGHDAVPSPRARRHLGRSAGRRRPRPHHRPNSARAARRPVRRGTWPARGAIQTVIHPSGTARSALMIAHGSVSASQRPNSMPSGSDQYQSGSVARPATVADQRDGEDAEREADDGVRDQPGEVAPDLRVAQGAQHAPDQRAARVIAVGAAHRPAEDERGVAAVELGRPADDVGRADDTGRPMMQHGERERERDRGDPDARRRGCW